MPRKYPFAVRDFVLRMLKTRHVSQVAEFTGIHRSTLYRWVAGDVGKRKLRVHDGRLDVVARAAEGRQRRCDVRDALREATGVSFSIRTIGKLLKAAGVSRKRAKRKRTAKTFDPARNAEFKEHFNALLDGPDDVIFQDESHFSNGLLPLYGYSRVGEPFYVVEKNANRAAHTLILAFSKSGQVFWKVYPGSVNTARMQWFVDALPAVPIVMDNHSVHKRVVPSAVFTPVAQPYANPVEIVFSKVKSAFRMINSSRPNDPVADKIDAAVATLVHDDLVGAIDHVRTFVNDNY